MLRIRDKKSCLTGVILYSSRNFSKKVDHYKTLGVEPTATQAEIKSAYFELSKKLHPDINSPDAEIVRRFQGVAAAYEVLGSIKSRKLYDTGGTKLPSSNDSEVDYKDNDVDEGLSNFYKSRLRRGEIPVVNYPSGYQEKNSGIFEKESYLSERKSDNTPTSKDVDAELTYLRNRAKSQASVASKIMTVIPIVFLLLYFFK